MKNYQKNATFPSVPVSCMTNQPIHAEYEKTHYGIYKRPNLEMHLNLWFKWTSNQMFTRCIIAIITSLPCSCIIMLHMLVFWFPTPFLLDRSCSGKCSRVPISGAVPPCWSTRQANDSTVMSHVLFYCIRTTMIQLLLCAAVVEPIPLHDLSLPQ